MYVCMYCTNYPWNIVRMSLVIYPYYGADAELAAYWDGVKEYSPGKIFDLGPLNRKNMVKHFTHFIFWVRHSTYVNT